MRISAIVLACLSVIVIAPVVALLGVLLMPAGAGLFVLTACYLLGIAYAMWLHPWLGCVAIVAAPFTIALGLGGWIAEFIKRVCHA